MTDLFGRNKKKLTFEPAEKFSMAENGFYGAFYKAPDNRFPGKALIIAGGSSEPEFVHHLLAQHFIGSGIDCLPIEYHGAPGLPKHLRNQPVETAGRAAAWLKDQGYEKIGIYGISMGTCMAVLAAAAFPELISCAVLVSPMYMVTQAERKNDSGVLDGSSFALYGEPFPYAKWNMNSLQFNFRYFADCIRYRDLYCRGILEQAYNGFDLHDAVLPVQNIRGSVLFISGSQESMTPADEASLVFMQTLEKNRFPYPHKHFSYPHLGHAIVPIQSPVLKLFKAERKYPQECAAEKKEAWARIIDFLREDW